MKIEKFLMFRDIKGMEKKVSRLLPIWKQNYNIYTLFKVNLLYRDIGKSIEKNLK